MHSTETFADQLCSWLLIIIKSVVLNKNIKIVVLIVNDSLTVHYFTDTCMSWRLASVWGLLIRRASKRFFCDFLYIIQDGPKNCTFATYEIKWNEFHQNDTAGNCQPTGAAGSNVAVRCPSVCLSQHGPTAADPQLQVCCCEPDGPGISIDLCTADA